MIRVLVVDDHKVFRQGLASILGFVADIEVVGEASDMQSVQEMVTTQQPAVILMDISLGTTSSGIEVTRWVKLNFPDISVLALSMHAEHEFIIEMLEAGASGYLLKDTGKEELFAAIRTVARGDAYYSKFASDALVQKLTAKRDKQQRSKKNIPLTKRELEVLKLIVEEFSNAEIASHLFISTRTVDTHKRNLLEKLQVKNTAGLVKYAIKHHLIE